MTNRVGSCTEPIVVTPAGIIRGLEQFPESSGARDSTTLAFQHVLASLARIEARLDASERRSASAQPPPRPEPKPPYEDWQRGRGEMGRKCPILSPATFVASQQNLGLVSPSTKIAIQQPRTDPLPWDRYGRGSEGFRGRRHTTWDNPSHKLDDQPGRLATEWDQNGGGSVGFRGRRPTAWDNPVLGFDDQPGRLAPKWDNAWGRQEGGCNSDQPRYDHYRMEKPRYEKMRAPVFVGSDAANLRAVHVDGNQKIGVVSSWQIPTEITGLRKKHDADALQVSSVSVTNTNIITEKGSDLVSLSTPATNTGGRDAIAVRSSVAVELNNSNPMEDTMKNIQNDNKDKNGDSDISNSSSDSEDEEGGPTMEDCLLQFKEMLKERGIKVHEELSLSTMFELMLKRNERKKRADQKVALEGFKQLLEEAKEDIDQNTDYQTFKRRWGEDPRFLSLDRRERVHLLNDRVLLLKRNAQEKAQAQRAVKTSNFKSLLKDIEDITSTSRWSKVKDSLRSDPRHKSVKHEDREKLFNEYVAELKAAVEETAQKAKAKQDEEDEIVILEGMTEFRNKFK
ncbi:hypothetical protein SASPL_130957 [Salvia splendens]|uniref:FF domain-containing protein n=1 Tax=Salvia splendens TaxID=180675 RepID=A0A8X8XA22_SALSN|nr:hypothetical protein SASPL_130957 [Salvia splendens]